MNKKIKRIGLVALAVLLAFSVAACAGGGGGGGAAPATPAAPAPGGDAAAPDGAAGGDVVELTFANVSIATAVEAGEVFKEVAERESGGTLVINHHPMNVLGDDRSVVELTAFGEIHLATSSTSPIASMHNDLFVFDAPYLFLSEEQADEILQGPIGQQILEDMTAIGLRGLMFWENGFRYFTSDHIPVNTVDDVSGVTVRVMENEIHIALWRALGANPTPMAMPEVFTALQQGTIDAQENTIGTIDGFGLYEIQSHISLTRHVYTPFFVVMHDDTWNSLTSEQQNAIRVAAQASVDFQLQAARDNDIRLFNYWENERDITISRPTPEAMAEFQARVVDGGVWDLIRSRMDNPQLMDDILDQLN
jgi:tripartite ATP-independent transporter DctP family solute receptor